VTAGPATRHLPRAGASGQDGQRGARGVLAAPSRAWEDGAPSPCAARRDDRSGAGEPLNHKGGDTR
jgi:hypothetical protein